MLFKPASKLGEIKTSHVWGLSRLSTSQNLSTIKIYRFSFLSPRFLYFFAPPSCWFIFVIFLSQAECTARFRLPEASRKSEMRNKRRERANSRICCVDKGASEMCWFIFHISEIITLYYVWLPRRFLFPFGPSRGSGFGSSRRGEEESAFVRRMKINMRA